MSHMRWIPLPSHKPPRHRSPWRFFPLAVVVALGVVVAVNIGLVYAALQSFPGAAGGDEGFALSNHYNTVLDQVQREAALGWTVQARTDDAGLPEVIVTDRDGAPLHGATVVAAAERPLGAAATTRLTFHEAAAGHYVADAALALPGQWDLTLTASSGGREMAATRRIIVH